MSETMLWEEGNYSVLYDSAGGEYCFQYEDKGSCRCGCCQDSSSYVFLTEEQVRAMLPLLTAHVNEASVSGFVPNEGETNV